MNQDNQQGLSDKWNSILQLANTHFDSLSQSEEELIKSIALGKEAYYGSGDEELDKPENHLKWDKSRTIRGKLIAWLCGNPSAGALIHHKGVRVKGAIIKGKVDLEGAILSHTLGLEKCVLLDELVLRNAVTRNLILTGSRTRHIDARELHASGSVLLDTGFHAEEQVNLAFARIDGELDCKDGTFKKDVIFKKGRDRRGKEKQHCAIYAERLTTYGSVIMSGKFHATGEVALAASQIGWGLMCTGGTFDGDGHSALFAPGLETRNGSVFLDKITAIGCVDLDKGRIRYDLHCEHSHFEHTDSKALKAEGLAIEGSVFLSKYSKPKDHKYEGFESIGEVSLTRADIGGNLHCQGAKFNNAKGNALSADYIRVRGGLTLSKMVVKPKGILNLHQAKVGHLEFDETSWPKEIDIDGLEYNTFSIPNQKNGQESSQKEDGSKKLYLEWLQSQDPKRFSVQPYEQLTRILRRMGREEDARDIAIAKHKKLLESSQWYSSKRVGDFLLDISSRYGYAPWRVMCIILIFVLLGTGIFYLANVNGKMYPSRINDYIISDLPRSEDAYPSFNAMIYSLDVFIPLVDLHHQDYWEPHPKVSWSWFYRGYTWIHTFLGWILSTLAAVSFAGIIRKT